MIVLQFLLIATLSLSTLSTQAQDLRHSRFHDLAYKQSDAWFEDELATQVADSILRYQQANGGWPKNQQWQLGADQSAIAECRTSGIGTTIDNGATTDELEFLRRIYLATGNRAYRHAFMRGVFFLLNAQYDNGGWPQFYPLREGYYSHITFNDGAMVNVMYLMKGIGKNQPKYAGLELDDELRSRCLDAYLRGLECILKCQIEKKGKPTVWCQQHDEVTFAPVGGRAYELPSLSGAGETEGIIRLLLDEETPSEAITNAIHSAKEWLEKHAIKNTIVEHFTNKDGQPDIRLKKKKGAPLLWARFYDLQSEKPFYCGRDGVVQDDLSKISYERRMGYSWISDSPGKLLR